MRRGDRGRVHRAAALLCPRHGQGPREPGGACGQAPVLVFVFPRAGEAYCREAAGDGDGDG